MSKTKKPQINFKYQKSAGYRNYQVDGIFGGILPTTKIWLDIFVEKDTRQKKFSARSIKMDQLAKLKDPQLKKITRLPENCSLVL